MKNKWFLYLTGFFSGMSVMAIELGASRLLAPYFSSSQIVWTIVIGTIMIAMSIGNLVGGKMADKSANPDKLFIWLFAAAVWTALIPLVGRYIIAGIALLLATFVTANYLIWAALISCVLVFVFPLLVLGMVTPNLVRFAVKDISDSGKVVGRIEALNTIGSIIGTFLPTFVTIPYAGTAWTFIIFAIILMGICLVYLILKLKNRTPKEGRKTKLDLDPKHVVKSVVMFLVASAAISGGVYSKNISAAFWEKGVVYEGESIYNYLRVEEDPSSVIFSTNVLFGVQSIKTKEPGLTGMYYDYALSSPVAAGGSDKELEILILGLGTGTFATQCQTYFPSSHIEGVEIDQKIVDLAYEYFDLSKDVDVFVEDGRAFLKASQKKYDVIMVDAYQDITIPFQLSSVEFFTLVSNHLNDNGNMVVNMNMYSSQDGGINDYLCGTIRKVFSSAYTVLTEGTNIELVASNNYDVKERLATNIDSIVDAPLKSMMQKVANTFVKEDVSDYILTDDKAPVELLGMKALDGLISAQLNYYKSQLAGKSLQEIIDELINGTLF